MAIIITRSSGSALSAVYSGGSRTIQQLSIVPTAVPTAADVVLTGSRSDRPAGLVEPNTGYGRLRPSAIPTLNP